MVLVIALRSSVAGTFHNNYLTVRGFAVMVVVVMMMVAILLRGALFIQLLHFFENIDMSILFRKTATVKEVNEPENPQENYASN